MVFDKKYSMHLLFPPCAMHVISSFDLNTTNLYIINIVNRIIINLCLLRNTRTSLPQECVAYCPLSAGYLLHTIYEYSQFYILKFLGHWKSVLNFVSGGMVELLVSYDIQRCVSNCHAHGKLSEKKKDWWEMSNLWNFPAVNAVGNVFLCWHTCTVFYAVGFTAPESVLSRHVLSVGHFITLSTLGVCITSSLLATLTGVFC